MTYRLIMQITGIIPHKQPVANTPMAIHIMPTDS